MDSVRHQQVEMFPTPEFTFDICHEALFHRDSAIWTSYSHVTTPLLKKEIKCMGHTIFSLSCWSMKPELPMLC